LSAIAWRRRKRWRRRVWIGVRDPTRRTFGQC